MPDADAPELEPIRALRRKGFRESVALARQTHGAAKVAEWLEAATRRGLPLETAEALAREHAPEMMQ